MHKIVDYFTWSTHTADIPNTAGYRLQVMLRTDEESNASIADTEVVRGSDGLHRLVDVDIRDVIAWRPRR